MRVRHLDVRRGPAPDRILTPVRRLGTMPERARDRANAGESIRDHQARNRQRRDSAPRRGFIQRAPADNLMQKRRASRSKELKDLSRRVREVGLDAVGARSARQNAASARHRRALAERAPREARACRSAALSAGRRQPRPTRFSRQTQRVEPRGIVVVDARRQHRAFPRRCRQLETVQHAEHRYGGRRCRKTDARGRRRAMRTGIAESRPALTGSISARRRLSV